MGPLTIERCQFESFNRGVHPTIGVDARNPNCMVCLDRNVFTWTGVAASRSALYDIGAATGGAPITKVGVGNQYQNGNGTCEVYAP
jgi:hypothetical protein